MVLYAAQRELGGAIYPVHARALRFRKFGQTIYAGRVFQLPEPYLTPARDEAALLATGIATAQLTNAIEGG